MNISTTEGICEFDLNNIKQEITVGNDISGDASFGSLDSSNNDVIIKKEDMEEVSPRGDILNNSSLEALKSSTYDNPIIKTEKIEEMVASSSPNRLKKDIVAERLFPETFGTVFLKVGIIDDAKTVSKQEVDDPVTYGKEALYTSGKSQSLRNSYGEELQDGPHLYKTSKGVGTGALFEPSTVEKNVKCNDCSYETYKKSRLARHIKDVHLKIMDWKCSQCSYKTTQGTHLHRHIKSRHTKVKEFKCDQCSYEATHKPELNWHVKRVHLKIRKFKCDYCTYASAEKRYLSHHINNIHFKGKVLKCGQCNFKAIHKTKLDLHTKNVHNKQVSNGVNVVLKKKYFRCDECNFKTLCKRTLSAHIKSVHTIKVRNLKCDYCSFEATRTKVDRHISSMHAEVKHFKCDRCDYKSANKKYLNRHIRNVHNKKNPR